MINHLMENLGMTRQDNPMEVCICGNFFRVVRDVDGKGHQVKLSGFGNFEIRIKANVQSNQRLAEWFMSQRAALLPLKQGKNASQYWR